VNREPSLQALPPPRKPYKIRVRKKPPNKVKGAESP